MNLGVEEIRQAIDLVSAPSERLGPLTFEPARRTISHQDGRIAQLEPRTAKLLVALLRAPGRVFSRDDLFASCWGGRAVGDDAVDQAVARLRRALAPVADGSIQVETVNKVGHRLILAGPAQDMAADRSGPPRKTRGPTIAAIAIVLLLIALVGFTVWRSEKSEPPKIAVMAQHGGGAEALARAISGDLAELSGARPDALTVIDAWEEADYLFRVSREDRDGFVRVSVNMIARGRPELLWSTQFQRQPSEEIDLREQAASKLSDLVICISEAEAASAHLGASGWSLFLTACDQRDEPPGEVRRDTLTRLTREAPDFAWGWAVLAYVEANMSSQLDRFGRPGGAEATDALIESARLNMLKARSLDPSIGEIYAVEEALIQEPRRWGERLALIDHGLTVDPNNPALLSTRLTLLGQIGQNAGAIATARRLVELRPNSASLRARLIITLAYRGNIASAWRELATAERIWPGLATLRDARFRLELRYGDPNRALQIIEQDETRGIPGDRSWPTERAFLRARLDPSPANVADVLRPLERHRRRDRIAPPSYVQALVQFDRTDDAYKLFGEGVDLAPMTEASDVLFRPHMRPFRNDPRFMTLVSRLGLLQFWRDTNLWPDFCADVDLPYDCRSEALRLLGP